MHADAMRAWADALLVIPRTLAENASTATAGVSQQLAALHIRALDALTAKQTTQRSVRGASASTVPSPTCHGPSTAYGSP